MDEHALVTIDRNYKNCTILTLNRPSKRNALSIELMEELIKAIQETQNRSDQRVLILNGAGTVFCAGLDLTQATEKELEERSSNCVGKVLKTLHDCPLITIAAIHGAALAGGAGLVSACDLAIAESASQFAFPETRRGLVAAQIMPYLLRLLSKRHLEELLYVGESIDAERAYAIGFINRVVKKDAALPEALKLVESIVKGAPQATAATKKLIQDLDPVDFEKGQQLGLKLHREMRKSKEAQEGLDAFLQKRSPQWS